MGFEHYEQNQQAKVQRIIADVAGDTALGESNAWAQGRLDGVVEVSRVFGKRLPCKEVVYTVNWKKRYVHHVGTVCKAKERWEWAVPQARAKAWIEDPRPGPGESSEWE